MTISTGKGDTGNTTLSDGSCVRKNDPRVYAYGLIDELNSHLGLVQTHKVSERTGALINQIQSELFIVGADLAIPISGDEQSVGVSKKRVTSEHVDFLTSQVKELENYLPPLKNFIIPGGCPAAAELQVSRALTRRAGRGAVDLSANVPTNPEVLRYLNRLSDLLFLLARLENSVNDVKDSNVKV